MSPLDAAHAEMQAAPDREGARLAFWHAVAATELHVPGDAAPRVFPTSDGPLILAFDDEARLADFLGPGPVERLSLAGRALAGALAGQGVGVVLNPGAPSETLIDAATLDWLAGLTAGGPEEGSTRILSPRPPGAAAAGLLPTLDAAFRRMSGLAAEALLLRDGTRHVLAVIDAAEGAEGAIAASLAEAVRFADAEATVDVVFLDAARARPLREVALAISLPERAARTPRPKDAPPRLR